MREEQSMPPVPDATGVAQEATGLQDVHAGERHLELILSGRLGHWLDDLTLETGDLPEDVIQKALILYREAIHARSRGNALVVYDQITGVETVLERF